MSPTPPEAPRRASHDHESRRERLRRALEDLYPGSPWRGVLTTALQAMDEPSQARSRALCWLHHAITVRLPADPRRDTLEHRVLRRAVTAIEEELDADDARAPRAA